jgi:hypothetical protein
MTILKCKTVGAGYESFFTVGKHYPADSDFAVCDDDSEGDDWFHWDLEADGVTVMSSCGDEFSQVVATFEIVEE